MVWLRRWLWLVGAVLRLWGIAWLGVPPLLKWQTQDRPSELLGRTVTVGEVDFSPWDRRLAAFLLSDAASYMTGQNVHGDGGRMSLNHTL